jgi:hypothetical protein
VKIRTNRYVRTLLIFVVTFLAGSLLSQAQSIPTNETPAPARIYHLLRETPTGVSLLGAALGAVFLNYSISAALWLATAISARCAVSCYFAPSPRPISGDHESRLCVFMPRGALYVSMRPPINQLAG